MNVPLKVFSFSCISVSNNREHFSVPNRKLIFSTHFNACVRVGVREYYVPKILRILHLNDGQLSFGVVLFFTYFVGKSTSHGGHEQYEPDIQKLSTTSTVSSSVKSTMQNFEDISGFIRKNIISKLIMTMDEWKDDNISVMIFRFVGLIKNRKNNSFIFNVIN